MTVGFYSVLFMALPAQAGLGDLLDDLLDPLDDLPIVGDIVQPAAEDVLDPLVDAVVDPIAGALVDPIVDQILAPVVAPVIETVLAPFIGDTLAPVTNDAPAPVTNDRPAPVLGKVAPLVAEDVISPIQETIATVSVAVTNEATEIQSLEVALALQTALVLSAAPVSPNWDATKRVPVRPVGDGRLDGLTGWLRNNADGLRNLLALPVRLLDLIARALLTAGSGLIAPLSMLLAFTAYLVKDRRWVRPHTSLILRSGARDRHPGNKA